MPEPASSRFLPPVGMTNPFALFEVWDPSVYGETLKLTLLVRDPPGVVTTTRAGRSACGHDGGHVGI